MPASRPRLERVLLTNDDGIDAPGLAVLEAVAAELADEVWVVAPEHDQSSTSHSISLHSPTPQHLFLGGFQEGTVICRDK